MGFFRRVKDHFIERTAPAVLNSTLMSDYGEITVLELDSETKKLHLESVLKGERDPIRVEIDSYEISRYDGQTFFTIKRISTSREWITTLARQQLVDRAIRLPKELAGVIGRLL